MSRLTKKLDNGMYVAPNISDTYEIKDKLGKLEDTEEQLGCSLDVVFNAMKNGVYVRFDDNDNITTSKLYPLYHLENVYFGRNPFGRISLMFGYKKEELLELKDYKKTWWLKEDKSE